MEPPKKISFSFSKSSKPSNVFAVKQEKQEEVELIDCLEGQSIKLKNANQETKPPLIIVLRDDAKTLLDRVKHSQLMVKKEEIDERPDFELTLDELAARELLRDAQKQSTVNTEMKVNSLPLINDKIVNYNDKEPTLDDYENVPIDDYGMAMLRGMGWTESTGIGKQNKQITKTIEPELRPKGMGLGANSIINLKKSSPPIDKEGKELSLIKGAYAKIIAGKHKGNYCEVLGLDDESGRIIVKIAIEEQILSLNEFLVMLVTKEEYTKCSKIINNAKYEEYKAKTIIVQAESSMINKLPEEKCDTSSSSEETSKYHTSSTERKRKHRSKSPSSCTSKQETRLHNEYKKEKSMQQKHSKLSKKYPEIENSDTSDGDYYNEKKSSDCRNRDEKRKVKKKKSRKHKKYTQDSFSSEEGTRKRKKSKRKKYRESTSISSSNNSSISDENTYKKSKHKQRQNKKYR